MDNYQRIETVIQYLKEHHTEQPDLATLADVCGLSPHHFHRLFHQWAGVTPKDFLRCLTHSHTRDLLNQGKSVLETTYSSGLSSPGRLHDLTVSLEAASPGEIKSGGHGLDIDYGLATSPFGYCLVAQSQRGLSHLSFTDKQAAGQSIQSLINNWPNASFHRDDVLASQLASQVFSIRPTEDIKAFVHGTPFQVQVWRALLQIPPGLLSSYSAIARLIDKPAASRAVGTAIGQNPLAYLIPCHRVIRDSGVISGYHWGEQRKRAMIAWESSQQQDHEAQDVAG